MSEKETSRTYNSILNSLVGIFTVVFNIILNLIVRITIIRTLGEEINGLHSLLQNILSIMATVETSMCMAMVIHLYEPVKNKDIENIGNILSFYKKLYFLLAGILFVFSLGFNFFLENLITISISMAKVRFYYFLFVLTFIFNYLTYVYRIVLFANQKNRVSSLSTLLAEVIFRGLAILLSIIFHSYGLFLLCFIGEKLLGNILCKRYVRRIFPQLRCSIFVQHGNSLKIKLFNTVKPLIVTRFAEVIQNSSQSILMSFLLGNIAIVGYYGNYNLVIGGVGLLYSQLGAAFTSSFGNLAIEKNLDRMHHAYRKSAFIMNVLSLILCSGFVACIQDFIVLFFGQQFLLSNMAVLILTMTLFITLLNIPVMSVQNAVGKHNLDVKNMLLQATFSIFFGYIGGSRYGIEGLLFGMLIPQIVFTTFFKGILIYKYVLQREISEFVFMICKTLFIGICVFLLSLVLMLKINTNVALGNIFIKGVLSVCVTSVFICLAYFRDRYFLEFMQILKNIGKKILCKGTR